MSLSGYVTKNKQAECYETCFYEKIDALKWTVMQLKDVSLKVPIDITLIFLSVFQSFI